MRLIDAEELERLFNEHVERGATDLFDAFDDALQDAQSVDAVPVVHCRHCRFYNKPRLGWCSVHLDREGPDDFCGYGARMDGDSDAVD
jgi:hypothetical protein